MRTIKLIICIDIPIYPVQVVEERLIQLALFNLAIDNKLSSCDLRNLKAQDVSRSGYVMSRAILKQQKTHQ